VMKWDRLVEGERKLELKGILIILFVVWFDKVEWVYEENYKVAC